MADTVTEGAKFAFNACAEFCESAVRDGRYIDLDMLRKSFSVREVSLADHVARSVLKNVAEVFREKAAALDAKAPSQKCAV